MLVKFELFFVMKISVAVLNFEIGQYSLTVTEQEPNRRKKRGKKRENVEIERGKMPERYTLWLYSTTCQLRSLRSATTFEVWKRDLRLAVFVEIFFPLFFSFSVVAVRQLFWAVPRIPGGQGPPQWRGRKELHPWTDRRDRQGYKKNSFCAIHPVRGQHGEGTAAVKCAREPLEGGSGSTISCWTSLFVHLNALIALKFLNSSISQTWLWKEPQTV